MDRTYRHLQDTFPQSGPVDVAFALEGRQHCREGKILAQGMNVWPIVVERDPAGIRVSHGLQSKPVLDFALLPVDRGQFRGQRWKLKVVGANWGLHHQILGATLLFEDVVVEENAFRRSA